MKHLHPVLCTKGAGIDQVEQVTGANHVAVLELDAGDEAADARPHLNLLDRLEAAGKFIPFGDRALDRLRDCDWRGAQRRG